MLYTEQLKTDQWKKRRLEILTRDNFTCKRCLLQAKVMQVHHKYYDKGKMAWEYDDDALESLCKVCHATEHGIKLNIPSKKKIKVMTDYNLIKYLGVSTAVIMQYMDAQQHQVFNDEPFFKQLRIIGDEIGYTPKVVGTALRKMVKGYEVNGMTFKFLNVAKKSYKNYYWFDHELYEKFRDEVEIHVEKERQKNKKTRGLSYDEKKIMFPDYYTD